MEKIKCLMCNKPMGKSKSKDEKGRPIHKKCLPKLEEMQAKCKSMELERLDRVLDTFVELLAKYGGADALYATVGAEKLWRKKMLSNMKESLKQGENYTYKMLHSKGLTEIKYKERLIQLAKNKIDGFTLDKKKEIIKKGLEYKHMWNREFDYSQELITKIQKIAKEFDENGN